jgi:ornithine cyclodeaminase
VLILNDHDTGYPFACLESSIISATRTAASAALAAAELHHDRPRPTTVTFFGTGLIARYLERHLHGTGWEFEEINIYDTDVGYAQNFADSLDHQGRKARIKIRSAPEEAVRAAELLVLATTAGKPHIHEVQWFDHCPTVLHISLRDLSPEIILASTNIVDDVEHCLKADTSPHLAEQLTGSRDFINGTLADVLRRRIVLEHDRPLVFSPFGLGILDLAVGIDVYREARLRGLATPVPDFFHDLNRYA